MLFGGRLERDTAGERFGGRLGRDTAGEKEATRISRALNNSACLSDHVPITSPLLSSLQPLGCHFVGAPLS